MGNTRQKRLNFRHFALYRSASPSPPKYTKKVEPIAHRMFHPRILPIVPIYSLIVKMTRKL